MKINLLTIGKSMPSWIKTGFDEYQVRLPKDYQLNLIEIKTAKHTIDEEGKALIKAAKNSLIVALDEHGKSFNTLEVAKYLDGWHNDHQDVSFFIGGPDGLSKECLTKAKMIWSLSKLTLPHMLVRVIFAEQIYRAWSIINHHPYHRE